MTTGYISRGYLSELETGLIALESCGKGKVVRKGKIVRSSNQEWESEGYGFRCFGWDQLIGKTLRASNGHPPTFFVYLFWENYAKLYFDFCMQGSDLAVGGKLEGAMGQSTAQKVLGNKRKRGDSTSGLVESSDSVSFNEIFLHPCSNRFAFR